MNEFYGNEQKKNMRKSYIFTIRSNPTFERIRQLTIFLASLETFTSTQRCWKGLEIGTEENVIGNCRSSRQRRAAVEQEVKLCYNVDETRFTF